MFFSSRFFLSALGFAICPVFFSSLTGFRFTKKLTRPRACSTAVAARPGPYCCSSLLALALVRVMSQMPGARVLEGKFLPSLIPREAATSTAMNRHHGPFFGRPPLLAAECEPYSPPVIFLFFFSGVKLRVL